MKKKKNKLTNFLKFGILLIGISLLLWNCEKEELIPVKEEQPLLQERSSKSITFETLENTSVYKYYNKKLQLDLKTDKHLNQFKKGIETTTNDITIITQKVNQVINNGVETFSMFVKYKEQQENTYYNLVLYKKGNTYRIYTLKIETSKKLFGKGTSTASMETDVTVQSGMVPPDGWEEEDTVDDGGIGYEWQCWSVTLQVAYSCGSGGHYPNGSGVFPQGCTGSPTVPYWPGYNYITDSDCGYVYIGTNFDFVNTDNDGSNSSGSTDSTIEVDTVNPSDLVPEGADPIEWFDEQVFIDTSFKNEPCLKNVYDKMGKASKFKEYLQNFEATASVADLRFTADNKFGQDPENVNYLNAMAITNPPLSSNEIKIIFNTDPNTTGNILDKPDVFKAVAMIHEIIHADMYRKMLDAVKAAKINQTNLNWRTWPNNTDFGDFIESLQNKYFGVFDFYTRFAWNTATPTSAQHQQMADRYRNTIKQVLADYDPTLTDTQKEALSWLGLNEANIVAWQNYPNKSSVTSTLTNIKNTYPNGCN